MEIFRRCMIQNDVMLDATTRKQIRGSENKTKNNPLPGSLPGVPKRVMRLINNITNAVCSISEMLMLFVLDKQDSNLDSGIIGVERQKCIQP